MSNFNRDFDPSWPTMMKSLQAVGYETATVGKTHYYTPDFRSGPVDLRDREAFVASFGWDHVFEEFDRYVHAVPFATTRFTEYLAELGLLENYRDAVRSVWRLTPSHWDGVTSPLPQEHEQTSFLADEAIRWLTSRDPIKPFFLKVAFVQPHVPLMADPVWAAYYEDKQIPLGPRDAADATNDVWSKYLAHLAEHSNAHLLTDDYVQQGARQYYGMVSLIDQRVGDIVATLERLGALDDTWVIYTSDHGEMLGDHNLMAKMNFYRASVEVPGIVRPPTPVAPRVVDEPTELIDLTATVIDVAGADPLEGGGGRSLRPLIEGSPTHRDILHSAIARGADDANFFAAVRTDRFRFTLEERTGTPCELFDLENDPDERKNLVDDAPDVVDRHRELVARYLAS